ncbi:MAG: LuxR C-terminal-related transcriptional regulator [Acidimicrobiaceae bacterium]|nr:LuxR C-terminal-related transcriptional regulator [Acidimicrobiaceae bacterium]
MASNAVKARARADLARLGGARLDNDGFRWEAAAILERTIGFDGWCWLLADPATRLPTRDLGENPIAGQSIRTFSLRHPGASAIPSSRSGRPVAVTSVETGGDLAKDPAWRETLGPAGVGDYLSASLVADGTSWAQLHLHRDSAAGFFDEDEAGFVAEMAPMLAARLRDGLRTRPPDGGTIPRDDPAEPGTIIVDEELSVVAATPAAWDWIDRLGLVKPNEAEPLPGFFYSVAARVALSRAEGAEPPPAAQARLQAADGRWTVVRAAPLTGAAGGYAITLEAARSEDLAPLLMRAWSLTAREREVARLVIDGLSTQDIAQALFISAHTVHDHVKAIFAKTGVTRRQDLVAALAGNAPSH